MITKNVIVRSFKQPKELVVDDTTTTTTPTSSSVLLKAIKWFWMDTRRFKMFAAIAFATWNEMQAVMIGLFGNKENDKYATDHLTVAYRMMTWSNIKKDFSLVPLAHMERRMNTSLSGIAGHLLDWSKLLFAKTNRDVCQSLVLTRLLRHMSDLRWEIKKILLCRKEAKGKEKTVYLQTLREFLPRVQQATTELEAKMDTIILCPERSVWHAPEVSSRWPDSITALQMISDKKYLAFPIYAADVVVKFPHLTEHVSQGFDSAEEIEEQQSCEISKDYVSGIAIFIEYCRYYFGLEKPQGVDKFLEHWCSFVDGAFNKNILKKYEATYGEEWEDSPEAPVVSQLMREHYSYAFNFGHLSGLVDKHFSSIGTLVTLINYCVAATRNIKSSVVAESCPWQLKAAREDLRFPRLIKGSYDNGKLEEYMRACYEANVYFRFAEDVFFHNLLNMMQHAFRVKQDAWSKKKAAMESVPEEVQKKQKKKADGNAVKIRSMPVDRIKIELGNGQEIDMPGFEMVFCPEYPSGGHVEIYRIYEVSNKWMPVLAGVIDNAGLFLHTKAFGRYIASDPWVKGYGDLFTLLKVLDSNPVECSSILARMTGTCLACGQPMTREESLKSGFGATCMQNLGLVLQNSDACVYQVDPSNTVVGNLPLLKKHKK